MRRSALETSALALALIACNQAPSPFEGAWIVGDGGKILACDGGSITRPIADRVVVIDENNVLFASIDGAGEEFAVSGNRASKVGQGPIYLTADGGSGTASSTTLTLETDTLIVNSDGLTEHATGQELSYASGGVPAACDFTRWFVAVRDSP